MKILFVSYGLSIGGLEMMLVNYANMFVQHGWSVTLLLLNEERDLRSRLDDRVLIVDTRPPRFRFLGKLPLFRNYYNDSDWLKTMSAHHIYRYVKNELLKNEQYDVEIAFCIGTPVKILSGSTNRRAVKIAWVHNDFRKCLGVPGVFGSIPKMIKAYQYFDEVMFVSKDALKGFKERTKAELPMAVAYNFCDKAYIKKMAEEYIASRGNGFEIVSVGRLTRAKGFDLLIDACAQLCTSGLAIHLTLVGDGDEGDQLHVQAENRGLDVTFTGKLDNPYPFMKNCDLYVCSSRWEGFNLTVVEALILNRPVLSTKCSGPVEILDYGQYGMLVDCDSASALAEGIRELLLDKARRDNYSSKAAARAELFEMESAYTKIEGEIRRCRNR